MAICFTQQNDGQTLPSITHGSENTRECKDRLNFRSDVLDSARYSLPCSIGALFGFFALTIGYIQFGETLRRDRHPGGINKAAPTSNFLSPASPTELDAHSQLTGVWTILTHPPLRHVLLTGFGASFLATAYEVVFALICYTPIHLGGLSRSVSESPYYLDFLSIYSSPWK